MPKAKAKKPATRKPRKPADPVAAAARVAAGSFKVDQRVTVTAPGSFAARQLGTVTAIDGGTVFVMLDHKQAAKGFPAADLAAA